MKIGVILTYNDDFEINVKRCVDERINTCQLRVFTDMNTQEIAEKIKAICLKYGMQITSLIGPLSGPAEWTFKSGSQTIGIIPIAYRNTRVNELIGYAKFASKLGVSNVSTHLGFIPENPSDELYQDFIALVKWIAVRYKNEGVSLNFETGQETPITLLRAIEDIDSSSVGINFDPANLLRYGKANPIDALSIVHKHIKGVHIKDAEYPTSTYILGLEKAAGEGAVNFPIFIANLKEFGYDGALTIEREIAGEQQWLDTLKARDLLEEILRKGDLC